jgi:methionyl-tRNA formyltransferase
MRVAFFGSDGELSRCALEAVVQRHQVVGVVAAQPRRSPVLAGARRLARQLLERLGARPRASLAAVAETVGAPCWGVPAGVELGEDRIAALHPDLICVAGYPWILRRQLFERAALGGVNLHGSLLPRHRGILPLFWIYYHDDRETGVTVHRLAERADAGAILAQEPLPLARGFSVALLNTRNAERGAALLPGVLDGLERGSLSGEAQDESRVTLAPRVAPGQAMVNFAEWEVERVWHFLAGLCPYFREPLRTLRGRPVHYEAVESYATTQHDRPLGSVERDRRAYTLFCRGGTVRLC